MKLLGLTREEARKILSQGSIVVALYGLGKLGLPLAVVLASRGAKVIGVDIKQDIINKINRGINPLPEEPGLEDLLLECVTNKKLEATRNGDYAAKVSDVHIIVVPLVVDSYGKPDFSNINAVVETIGGGLKEGDIVITETTLPPGTTEKIGEKLEDLSGLKMGEDFGVAHAPERTMSGRMIKDITESYPKIVGASDPKTLEAVCGFYEAINKRGVIAVSSLRVAEAVKVFEGVYRDVNIALANELAKYAEIMGFDVYEAIRAANTQPYSHIHKPGAGVGGHCIPVYPYFLIYTAQKAGLNMRLLSEARIINDSMPIHTVYLILKALNSEGKSIKNSRILILGLTFRPGVKEYYKSPAKNIIKELKEMGAKIYAHDPLASNDEIINHFNVYPWRGEEIDIAVIVTEYREFKEKILRGEIRPKLGIIVDGRRLLEPHEAEKIGLKYWGIGYPNQ